MRHASSVGKNSRKHISPKTIAILLEICFKVFRNCGLHNIYMQYNVAVDLVTYSLNEVLFFFNIVNRCFRKLYLIEREPRRTLLPPKDISTPIFSQ